jgi:superfamily I DNA/RNA helicase
MAWELEQEDNLCYVAATRAKQELILVEMELDK